MNKVGLYSMFTMLVLTLSACGGSAPEPKAAGPSEAPPPAPKDEGPKMQVSGQLGSLDPKAVDDAFNRSLPKLRACVKKGQKRVEFLAGDVKFFLRIGLDGSVKYAYLEDSTIGDRETEKCMIDALSTSPWPKPDGGEAEVRSSTGFDPPDDVRQPDAWNGDKIAEALGHHDTDFKKCKEGVSGAFKVTAYVEPDAKEKKHGKITAVGMAPPSREGEGKIECLIDAVKDMKKVPSPGSYAAKVTFTL